MLDKAANLVLTAVAQVDGVSLDRVVGSVASGLVRLSVPSAVIVAVAGKGVKAPPNRPVVGVGLPIGQTWND